MNTIKNSLLFSIIVLLIWSCDPTFTNPVFVDTFDHASQLTADNDALTNYFKTHYYNPNDENIWRMGVEGGEGLPSGEQIPLYDSPNLKTIEGIEENGITNYKMYYLITKEGSDFNKAGSPSQVDSVLVNYTGFLLDSTIIDSRQTFPVWFDLSQSLVGDGRNGKLLNEGWAYGLQNFLGGELDTPVNGEIKFKDSGEGFIFYPSGLGYRNFGSGGGVNVDPIPASSPLMFKITLNQVKLTDFDRDLVPSKYELGGQKGAITLDTDEDGFSDYRDQDDDGDGVLTKDEADTNKDGVLSEQELNAYLEATYQ